jgi:deoxyribodipyrimidine photo-lyase
VKVAIHWFRRDLRLDDNTALAAAAKEAETVVPVFIAEDALRTGPDVGAARLAFLLKAVESLRNELRVKGCSLLIRRGKSEEEIPKLCRELGAEAVFCNRRYEPYAQARDARIMKSLASEGVAFRTFKDAVVWEDRELLTKQGEPYTVFTPYAKAWKTKTIPPPRPMFQPRKHTQTKGASDDFAPDPADFGRCLKQPVPPAGEAAALIAFRRFVAERLTRYDVDRDFPGINGTSQLSPHLRCGTIGVRTLFAELHSFAAGAAETARESIETFIKELIWREFYLQILSNFPHVMNGAFRPEYDRLKWSYDEGLFRAWQRGQTGYPLVDASMRCLNATGWLHNRMRMVVAMFLTKDLLLNWQLGERYFMQMLVDGDMAANNGGWQWSAGTGTDAAPYFRIFNPVSQSRKFDPKGEFIRRWIPELDSLSDEAIHEPWDEPLLAKAYAQRIVIHEEQRLKCLKMYQAVSHKRP